MNLRMLIRQGALTLSVATVLATPTAFISAATAATPAPRGAGVVCETDEHDEHGHSSARRAGKGRGPDHAPVSEATARQVNAQARTVQQQLQQSTTDRVTTASGTSARLADRVVIRVYVRNIYGAHRGERDLRKPRIHAAIRVLNEMYAGMDEPGSLQTRYRFALMSIRTSYNDRWYHSAPGSRVDRANKRRYHRGGKHDLNIYIREPRIGGDVLLGYSSFPWQYRARPRQDGVTIHPETLPGRQMVGYNQNDTMAHEIGHWLGLFHVFEGGCDPRPYGGDGVPDTHPQQPTFNSCIVEFLCSPHGSQPDNYMQYTPDSCMRTFTPGQASRMDAMWLYYRA